MAGAASTSVRSPGSIRRHTLYRLRAHGGAAVSYALSSLQGEETHPGRSEYSG